MSDTNTVSPLRQRMIEDMAARKLNPHTQRGHIYSCGFAWLKRSPDTTADEVRQFQLYLVESGMSISNRNRIMTRLRSPRHRRLSRFSAPDDRSQGSRHRAALPGSSHPVAQRDGHMGQAGRDADQSSARYERCRSAVGPPGRRTRSVCTCQGL